MKGQATKYSRFTEFTVTSPTPLN